MLEGVRARAVGRILRGVHSDAGEVFSRQIADQLRFDHEAQHTAAIEALRTRGLARVADQLAAAHADAIHAAADLLSPDDVLQPYTTDADAYVRTVVLYARSERGRLDEQLLDAAGGDEHGLVRETGIGLRGRRITGADSAPELLTVEKMIALRRLPLFASLGAPALEELAPSSMETHVASGEALCILFVGIGAGNLTMTGAGNTATGLSALTSNTDGISNTASGARALE